MEAGLADGEPDRTSVSSFKNRIRTFIYSYIVLDVSHNFILKNAWKAKVYLFDFRLFLRQDFTM